MRKPTIVCLCGSTRFKDAYNEANFKETLAGRIVLSVGCFIWADKVPVTHKQKRLLDKLHLRKIDLADEILVLNVGGHIGNSTKNEIEYALRHDKKVRFWEKVKKNTRGRKSKNN